MPWNLDLFEINVFWGKQLIIISCSNSQTSQIHTTITKAIPVFIFRLDPTTSVYGTHGFTLCGH